MSTHAYRGIGAVDFVGLENFRNLLRDTRFLRSVLNTLYYSGGSTALQIPIGLLLAIALNSLLLKAKDFFRVAFFAPVVIPTVVVTLTFKIIYDTDFGFLNYVLGWVGISPIDWLGSTRWAMPALIFMVTWRYTGLAVVYFLAGLQTIPRDLYQAAEVDGANMIQKFFFITLPGLRHTMVLVLVLSIINSIQVFTEPWVMTKGGPGISTLTMGLYLYQSGFAYGRLGYAAAIGYSMLVIIIFFTSIQFRLFGLFRED